MSRSRKEPRNGKREKQGYKKPWDVWLILSENKIQKKKKRMINVLCNMLQIKIGKKSKKKIRKNSKQIKEIKKLGKHWLYKCKKK